MTLIIITYMYPIQRDERRRVTHNEVERRRRDKINNWISKLGKLLPECEQSATGDGDLKTNFELQVIQYMILIHLHVVYYLVYFVMIFQFQILIRVFYLQSKGGILARACQYITELRDVQENFQQSLDENAQLLEEARTLRQVVNQLRKENSELKDQIAKSSTYILGT